MRKLSIVWTVCCLAIGLSACTTMQPSHLDTAKACADWRWIGISQPEAQCPEVAGWIVRPMFPQLSPVLSPSEKYCAQPDSEKAPSPSLDVVRELNRFCVYEIKAQRKKLKDLAIPSAASAGLVRLDQDCAALSLTAAELDKETWMPESPAFLAQVGQPKESLGIHNRSGVRLAFLDTQPDGDGIPQAPGNSQHGYTLAHIARQLICSPEDSRCAARITTRLALPILEFNAKDPKQSRIDTIKGGYLGMQSDLATAILSEVRSWQQAKSERHLVLNLSMAWDGELFGGLDEDHVKEMRAGTQAVYNALRYASESDVLVLAAAGNQKIDPCANNGPLLPAAWEKGAAKKSCPEVPETQLLYAVGGLQSNEDPLDNARPGGMPRRAAYGEASIFSGSSVATAVASSIAAMVWSHFPDLESHQVMEILDTSGKELRFPADFWFGASSPVPQARKLSLCDALRTACLKYKSPICESPCDPLTFEQPESTSKKNDKKVIWKGSCQPWLFPQPEDTPQMSCTPPC